MFKRLLVPLDGSKLAEAILPVTSYMAEKFGAEILLFHAIEQDAPDTVHGERHLVAVNEAEAYLDELAVRLARPNVVVTKHVHTAIVRSDIARSIIDHALEHQADLVILCAHGHGGWRDRFVGNIAQQVISFGKTPVVCLNHEENVTVSEYACRNILLPLDVTPYHEPAFPAAKEIARVFGATLHLINVVPTRSTLSPERAGTGMLLPSTMSKILELSQEEAVDYLQGKMRELSDETIRATAQVARGDIAAAILDAAKRADADLVVLATHGRSSLDAFWSGSVTPKVLTQSQAPVLLIRVTGEEAER
ncbi:MAG: universal stress protein [Chloroflexi bacterium]|nr:universal stress protein [Chloroflexota bacterium]